MRIRDTPEFIGPLFPADSFVLMTIHISPTERRVHRVSPDVFAAAAGPAGPAGADGADGVGVPVGGTAGQVLSKIDGTDYNTEWVSPSGGGDPVMGGDISGVASNATVVSVGGTVISPFVTTLLDDVDATTFRASIGTDAAGDSRPPNGAAGGDLGGTYPNPTVVSVGGTVISPFVTTLLDDVDAATFRASIGTDASGASRPPNGAASGDLGGTYPSPTVVSIGGTVISAFVTTLVNDVDAATFRASIGTDASGASRPPNGAASGDLGGTYPSPTVTQARGIRETAGPTTLVVGAIADGEFLKRTGATVVGVASPGLPAGGSAFNILAKDGSNVPGWTANPTVTSLNVGTEYNLSNESGLLKVDSSNATASGVSIFSFGVHKATIYFDIAANTVLFQNRVGEAFAAVDESNLPIDFVARSSVLDLMVSIDGLRIIKERQPAVVDLVDNTAGTASGTLAAITDPADTPITADALRDDLVANTLPPIRNALASLSLKIAEWLDTARAHGLIFAPTPIAPGDPILAYNDGTGVGIEMPASIPQYADELVLFRDAVEIASGLQPSDVYPEVTLSPNTAYTWTVKARNASGDSAANATPLMATTADVPIANEPNLLDDGGGNYTVSYAALGTDATAHAHLFVQVNGGGYSDVGEGAFVALVGDTIDAKAQDLNIYGTGPDSTVASVTLV